jgi:hypothetical protein
LDSTPDYTNLNKKWTWMTFTNMSII